MKTVAGGWLAAIEDLAGMGAEKRFPSAHWRERGPIEFARVVLGYTRFWRGQRQLIEACWKHKNVTCRSGHKCGKTLALTVFALWFMCSFPSATVVAAATNEKQIQKTLYREIRIAIRRAKTRGYDLIGDGIVSNKVTSGITIVDPDGSERLLYGLTASSAEAAAGISGQNIVLIADEASGIRDKFFEAFNTSIASGNEVGFVRRVYLSNPTRIVGEFARSHNSKRSEFYKLHMSSRDTPNAYGEGPKIPGLASKEYCDEQRDAHGEDSAIYRVRVLGEFPIGEESRVVTMELAQDAAYTDIPDGANDVTAGRLVLGIDPAGAGLHGDRTGFAVRRGMCVLHSSGLAGLTEDGILARALELLAEHTHKDEDKKPIVVVDADGDIGGTAYRALRNHSKGEGWPFDVVAFRSSAPATKMRDVYLLQRDELYANFSAWVRAGGKLPNIEALMEEVLAPAWGGDKNGKRITATDKRQLRRDLGRSPDLADAVMLACWGSRPTYSSARGISAKEWHADRGETAAPTPLGVQLQRPPVDESPKRSRRASVQADGRRRRGPFGGATY